MMCIPKQIREFVCRHDLLLLIHGQNRILIRVEKPILIRGKSGASNDALECRNLWIVYCAIRNFIACFYFPTGYGALG